MSRMNSEWPIRNSEANIFLALAKSLWARGEDGAVIARDLALAFLDITKGGTQASVESEFKRFIDEGMDDNTIGYITDTCDDEGCPHYGTPHGHAK